MLPYDTIYHPAHAPDNAPEAPVTNLPEPLRIGVRKGAIINLRRLCGLLFGGAQ